MCKCRCIIYWIIYNEDNWCMYKPALLKLLKIWNLQFLQRNNMLTISVILQVDHLDWSSIYFWRYLKFNFISLLRWKCNERCNTKQMDARVVRFMRFNRVNLLMLYKFHCPFDLSLFTHYGIITKLKKKKAIILWCVY